MRFCAILGAILVLCASGCTLRTHRATAPTTPTTVVTNPHMPVPDMALTVYRVAGGRLAPSVVHVPTTRAVAAAALAALGIHVPVTISNGTATVSLANATEEQVAEIVYTLTQFPSVQHVDVAGRTSLARSDFDHWVPPVVVESPAAGATVQQRFRVTGTASVYEATLLVELVRAGEVLDKQTVTASAGAPARGTFETTLDGTAGAATVLAFAPSAADGSPQHEVDVPVTISP
jgi:hypothetical protein